MITLGNKSCPNKSCLNPLTHPLPLLNKPLLATCHILFLTCPIPLPNTTHYNLASQGIYTSKINILCLFCICLDLCLVIVLPLSCPCLVPYLLPLLPPLKPGARLWSLASCFSLLLTYYDSIQSIVSLDYEILVFTKQLEYSREGRCVPRFSEAHF